MNRFKYFIYKIVGRIATIGWRRSAVNKRLLIVRVDEIGDYMLWRPFLKTIAESDLCKEYEIHFCGSKLWKSLFETLDGGLVDKCFWVDKKKFKQKIGYRYHFLREIFQQKYDMVINPTFSRDPLYDDTIVKAAKADKTIGMVGNLESAAYDQGYDKKLYTQLFDHKEKPVFEFFRNKLFAEFIAAGSYSTAGIKIDTQHLPPLSVQVPGKYFVVFPGARTKLREWPTENFVAVSKYLFQNYGWTAVVAGTHENKEYTGAFVQQYTHPVIDLTGKTSLVDMLSLLKEAECLLTVDTSSVHLAAAVGCAVFGIYNGSHYKRFGPYPFSVADNIYAIYPDDVDQEVKDTELLKKKYEFLVTAPHIPPKPEKMILAIHQHFS